MWDGIGNKLKIVGIAIVMLLVVIVVLQNTQPIETKLLFLTVTMPRAALLFGTLVVGFAIGVLTAGTSCPVRSGHRRRSDRPPLGIQKRDDFRRHLKQVGGDPQHAVAARARGRTFLFAAACVRHRSNGAVRSMIFTNIAGEGVDAIIQRVNERRAVSCYLTLDSQPAA